MRNGGSDTDDARMKYFFNPGSIAIIGASDKRRKPGGRPLPALRDRAYAGQVYPINPQYQEIAGFKCYPSILDVPGDVDMAVISIPAASVPGAIEECATKGVKAAVIFSAGFSEVDAEGEALQERITEIAQANGMRILGPNCLGIMNLTNSVLASFAFVVDLEPVTPMTMGFVSQSGAYGAMMFDQATSAGVGFSSFTSVGNEADAEFSEFLEYLLGDPNTRVLGGYLEGAKDGARFRRAAEQALRLEKPILIMKVGRTGAGARAASSHTGSLAGDDQIYDAFFKQMGIVRIEDLSELISFAILHRCGRSFEGKRVVILSGSGGRGVMLADKCERLGLDVPEITGTTRARLEEALPAFGSAKNPVDMTAGSGGDYMTPDRCLRALIDDENSDIVLAQPYFHHGGGMQLAEEFLKLYDSTDKPIVLLSHRRARVDEDDEPGVLVEKAGVPVLTDAAEAVQAMAHLAWYQQKVKRFRAAEQSLQPRVEVRDPRVEELLGATGPLTEFDCKQILKGYEIPITREGLATSADEAVELAGELGYPVVLKVQSGQILHKTEADGIALDLDSDEAVRDAYDAILASAKGFAPDAEIQGVLVQEMVGDGVEVIIGVTQDPVFGPAIMFGLGGIFVEALRDVSFRVAPLLRPDAEDMLDEIRGRRVLEGMRGKPPADREALIDVILKVSQLVCDHRDRIEELDINPLMVFPKGAKALDALITRRGGGVSRRGDEENPMALASDKLMTEAAELMPGAVALRRKIHANPEVGLDLPETTAAVLESLEGVDLEIERSERTTGFLATLRGSKPGPSLLLRADMDALPIAEDTELEFKSRNEGRMHGCGHDVHCAMLAAAARLLDRHRDELTGNVVLMFQPGEEGYFGAKVMVDEGLLDRVSELAGAFAIHVTPEHASGRVASRPGPFMAAADYFQVELEGRGGHASMPHQAVDPIPVACEIVQALQTLVARRIYVFDPVVLSVTQIHAGTTGNVIPETAKLVGSLRSTSQAARELAQEGIRRVATQIAAAHEVEAKPLVINGYPVTVNDAKFSEFARRVTIELLGEEAYLDMAAPLMGAEDFSCVLEKIPGAMVYLGMRPPGDGPHAPIHSNRMLLNEDAMQVGIALHAAIALRFLE